MKKFLNDEFYNNAYKNSKKNIEKYVDQSDPNFSFELFHYLLNFYLKWNFSYPQLQIDFMDYAKGKEFDSEIMEDLILIGNTYKFNFCYLPVLKYRDKKIKGYVFTYLEGRTFIKEDCNYEIVKQIRIE